jgi:hypothetical protein
VLFSFTAFTPLIVRDKSGGYAVYGDGYTDNFQGWDMSENDNNPNVDNSTHGSHVSGCAAASTDNAIGVASPGFKCKFLPVTLSIIYFN